MRTASGVSRSALRRAHVYRSPAHDRAGAALPGALLAWRFHPIPSLHPNQPTYLPSETSKATLGPVWRAASSSSLNTAVPFAALWLVMVWSLSVGYWLTLLLSIPAAGLLVRLFIIQHDCGHGSFFRSRALNDRLGGMLGVLTLVPYSYWKKTHAMHHATSGDLSRRGFGDVATLDRPRVPRALEGRPPALPDPPQPLRAAGGGALLPVRAQASTAARHSA